MDNKYRQESYAAVACTVQLESIFLERVTTDMGQAVTGLEVILRGKLFASYFLGKIDNPPPNHRISK